MVFTDSSSSKELWVFGPRSQGHPPSSTLEVGREQWGWLGQLGRVEAAGNRDTHGSALP